MPETPHIPDMTERTFDYTRSESLTNELVEAVAEHRGIDALDPDFSLYDELDIAAMERLVRSESPTDICIQFRLDDDVVRLQQATETKFRISVGRPDSGVLCK